MPLVAQIELPTFFSFVESNFLYLFQKMTVRF